MTDVKPGPVNYRRPQVSKKEFREIVYRGIGKNLGAELQRRYHPDCCIAATRAALTVCELFDIVARPVKVKVFIFNRAMAERAEREGFPRTAEETVRWGDESGAWSIGVGVVVGDVKPGRWPGHLALLTEDDMLIDASIAQADRPERGIRMPGCLVAKAGKGFGADGRPFSFVDADGTRVCYVLDKEDPKLDFRKSRDWADGSVTNPVAMAVGRVIAAELVELADERGRR